MQPQPKTHREALGGRLTGEGMYINRYLWFIHVVYSRNQHNIVKQFSPQLKIKKKNPKDSAHKDI